MSLHINPALLSRGLLTEQEDAVRPGKLPKASIDSLMPKRIEDNQDAYLPNASLDNKTEKTYRAATGAWNRIMDSLGFKDLPTDKRVQLKDFENLSMETMMLAMTLVAGKALSNTAELKAKALSIMSDKQEAIREQEIKDYREQMDKAVEQQNAAKKAGIFGVLFDWVVAAVELVSGVAKLVGGLVTANPFAIAGGAMDLMAGLAGVVKATMNTLALIDPKNADSYRKVADIAGKVQLAFEIAGAVVDITSAARNMMLTKAIPKATEKLLQEGTEKVLMEAIEKGSQQAVEKTAKEVGKQVASQVSEQIMQGLGKAAVEASKTAAKEASQKLITNKMMEYFSQQAIEKLVTKSIEKVAGEAIEKGIQLTAEALTKAIVDQVKRDVLAQVLKASLLSAVNTTRATVTAASQVVSGVSKLEQAELQKEIDQLIIDQQWLQMCFQFYEQSKEAARKDLKALLQGAGDAIAEGSKTLKQSASVQLQALIAAARV